MSYRTIIFLIIFGFISLSWPSWVGACELSCWADWSATTPYYSDYNSGTIHTSISNQTSQQTVNGVTTGNSNSSTTLTYPNDYNPGYTATLDQVAAPVVVATPTPTPTPKPVAYYALASAVTTQTHGADTSVTINPTTDSKPIILEAKPSTDASGNKTVTIAQVDESNLPQAGINTTLAEGLLAGGIAMSVTLGRFARKQKRLYISAVGHHRPQ